MAMGQTSEVIQHLRSAMCVRDGAGMTDVQLLEDYISRHDEAAFAALVQRHGAMVWGVCRRVLSNYHDAEDAFQATFLVLVRRAASIASAELLANWLYGVAHQTAMKARATLARRKDRERQVTEMSEPTAGEGDLWNDLEPLLDQELSRLPDIHRVVIVLCDLEGRTRAEAARHLGLPEGTVGSRLARARAMLAKRLRERGITLSVGALAAVLSDNVARSCVPASVVSSTIRVASVFAVGQAAQGSVSVDVAALTEGVLKAMMMSKLKTVVAVVLMVGLLLSAGTVLSSRMAVAKGYQPPAAEVPVREIKKEGKDKESFTAWGKEEGGLQAGLGYLPGEHRAYGTGETVTLVVRVRNVGTEAVKFQYVPKFFFETPPTVTDGEGKPVTPNTLGKVGVEGEHPHKDVDLVPGKEVILKELKLQLKPVGDDGKMSYNAGFEHSLQGIGKFNLQYEQVLHDSSSGKATNDPALSKLGTGKLELVVKEAEKTAGGLGVSNAHQPPAAEVPLGEKKKEKAEEVFTAWGKEEGGLQAGLGYLPGEHRIYSTGDTVTLVVRVRNVSKEVVKFQYVPKFFFETSPIVTDGEGKPVILGRRLAVLGEHPHKDVDLAPGKEVVLKELKLQLKPAGDDGKMSYNAGFEHSLQGIGKFNLQYEQVLHDSSSGKATNDPALSKLGTGKLELVVKEAVKTPVRP